MGGFAEFRSLGLIVELFLKSSVVLAAGMLVSQLLSRGRASLRHFLLSLSLVGLAFLPALSVFSPGWHAPWLPDWTVARPELEAGAGVHSSAAGRPVPELRGEAKAERSVNELRRSNAEPSGMRGQFGLRSVLGAGLSVLWLAGLVLILARLAAGLYGARRLTREGREFEDSAWQRLFHRFVYAVRLKRRVDIKAHPEVIVPLTWGFRRPVVILPEGARDWTEDERSSALFHELSHVKRGDFLVMLFVRLSLAVFWLNPLSWVAFKMLKKEQEKACDELVLKAGIRPSTYANNLLFFKSSVRSVRSPLAALPGVLGMFGRSEFRERVLVILGRKMAFKEVPMKTKVAISFLAFAVVAFIGLARPQTATATPEPATALFAADVAVAPAAALETPVQDAQKVSEKPKKEEPKKAEPKKEEQVKKEIKIVKHEHGAEPIELTIIEGQTKKTIKLDGGVIIKKGEDGKTVVLDSEGQDLAVIEGEGAEIKIKGGQIIFDQGKGLEPAKEPKVFTVIEDDQKTSYVLEDKKAHTVIVKSRPHVEVVKEIEEPEHVTVKLEDKEGAEYTIAKRVVVAEPVKAVHVDEKELEKKIAETQALLKKIDELKLAESDLKAQQETLKELHESLQALQEELDNTSENLKALKVVVAPKVHVTHERTEAPEAEVEIEEAGPVKKGGENFVTVTDGKEAYTIMLDMKLKGNPKETYEKAVARLETELPEGYKLEPKLDEKSGTMVIKITGPRGTEQEREKIQKLIKELQAEFKR